MTDNYLDRYMQIELLNSVSEVFFSVLNDSETFDNLLAFVRLRSSELQTRARLGELSDQERA